MVDSDLSVPKHFVVVVPGMMGSKLRDRRTGEIVWLDFDSFPLNPLAWDDWIEGLLDRIAYPNPDLEPAGILDHVMFMSPWAKQEQYGRLLHALTGMGYCGDPSLPEAQRNLYAFGYDWRQDIRISGRLLGEAIERWHVLHDGAPAWVIGHSMGGIAARWYIEKEGGKDFVSRLFLMASPWNGSPKATHMLFNGMDVFMRSRFNPLKIRELTRKTIRSFPSAYQILPHQGAYLRDQASAEFDPLASEMWLDNAAERALLADACRFNEELGNTLSVETLCFFGRKRSTVNQGIVRLGDGGMWLDTTWESELLGDGAVLETSAVHEAAQVKLPFITSHGSIYVHPGVLEVLQWELRDKFCAGAGASRPASVEHKVALDTDQHHYLPGATIHLTAMVEGPLSAAAQAALDAKDKPGLTAAEAQEALEAIQDGRIHVQLAWQADLPGNPPLPAIPDVVFGVLRRGAEPGQYVGQIQSPHAEGYYHLLTELWVDGVRAIDSHLLLVDDGHPGWSA